MFFFFFNQNTAYEFLYGLVGSEMVIRDSTYPWLVLVGWWYVRRAEANERDFADLVGDTEGDAPQEHS